MLRRLDVYNRLREGLFAYSEQLHSAEIEIFAIEMEIDSSTGDSYDPALFDEFQKLVPETMTLAEAFSLAADYIDREIVTLRHVKAAQKIVNDLRVASVFPSSREPGRAKRESDRKIQGVTSAAVRRGLIRLPGVTPYFAAMRWTRSRRRWFCSI